jgi:hypothetical protein
MYNICVVLLFIFCFTSTSVETSYAGGKGYILHETYNCPKPTNCYPRMP